MRTIEVQLKINEDLLIANIAKLQTSINNLKDDKGKSRYMKYTHLQDDALSVVLGVEKYLLLQMMHDTENPDG